MATKKTKAKVKPKGKLQKKAKPVSKPKVKAKGGPKAKTKTKATFNSKPQAVPRSVLKLSPLADRIVVVIEGPSEMTAGGIIIPGTVSDRPSRGQVLAKGKGKISKKGHLKPLDVGVGDIVLFQEYAGNKITFEGQDYLILREEDVLGIVT